MGTIFVFDYETTGLDTATLTPLEFAFAVIDIRDGKLTVLRKTETFLLDVDPEKVLWQAGAYELAKDTGLLADLKNEEKFKYSMSNIEHLLDAVAKKYPRIAAGGSGIGEFDRKILERFHPEFNQHLFYRSADLGNFRQVLSQFGIKMDFTKYPFGGFSGAHRAGDDVDSFIAQYQYFLETISFNAVQF